MDVSAVPPFSRVNCPRCGENTRVKNEFGPYTLLRRHAIGGMSVVFIARDNTLDREVALKILNEEYSASGRRIAAFEEEARITASISHPHVVRVLTTGRAFGRFYIAMELVTGGHLEHQIRERGALPESEVLPLAIEVAEGLRAAHAVGLIHRDIKPGNILLDAMGHAKIVDFGLALVTMGGKAQAKEIWATPYYVPPEAIEGRPEDFRSDIYAFGATFYHALAGKPPCGEESMVTTILREAKLNVRPLAAAAPQLNAETCAVIDRAMAFEPGRRFQSYDELIAALKFAWLQSSGEAGSTETALMRRRRLAKRREKIWMVVAAASLLSLIGGAVLALKRPPKPREARAVDEIASVVEAPAGEATLDPAVAERIGNRYKEARTALEGGELLRAQQGFAALRDDPEVMEPTGTWAGVEAVISALLDGRGEDAREEAKRTLAHLNGLGPADEKSLRVELAPLLESFNGWAPLSAEKLSPANAAAPDVMVWMLAGLKEWEQGRWALAARFFTVLLEAPLRESEGWARLYQQLARNYLADQARLAPFMPGEPAQSVEACRAQREALDRVLGELQTRGRARFNVRAWQLELARREHDLREEAAVPKPPPMVAWQELRPAAEALCRQFQFAEAVARLKTDETEPENRAARDALLAMAALAGALFDDLEDDLKKPATGVSLVSHDGKATFVSLALVEPHQLKAMDADGKVLEIGWADLSPDAVIELHRRLVRNAADDADRLRRHETAIAFDWLAGDRARATAAAERLAKDNPEFKTRWEALVAALKP